MGLACAQSDWQRSFGSLGCSLAKLNRRVVSSDRNPTGTQRRQKVTRESLVKQRTTARQSPLTTLSRLSSSSSSTTHRVRLRATRCLVPPSSRQPAQQISAPTLEVLERQDQSATRDGLVTASSPPGPSQQSSRTGIGTRTDTPRHRTAPHGAVQSKQRSNPACRSAAEPAHTFIRCCARASRWQASSLQPGLPNPGPTPHTQNRLLRVSGAPP